MVHPLHPLAMACSSCAIVTLQNFLRGINIGCLVNFRANNTQPLAKGWAQRRRSLYTRTALRTSSASLRVAQPPGIPALDDQFVPFIHSVRRKGHDLREHGGLPEVLSRSTKRYKHTQEESEPRDVLAPPASKFDPGLHATYSRPQVRCRKGKSVDQESWTETPGGTAADRNSDILRPNEADHTIPMYLPEQLSNNSASSVMDPSSRQHRKPRTRKMVDTSPNSAPKKISFAQKNAKRSTTSATQTHRSQETWQIQKNALSEKFGSSGWWPRKRLSPDALDGIRTLHAQHPNKYTTPVLADEFKISPEAVRRILKSNWRPNEVEVEERAQRWEKRGESIWSQMVEVGIKPPKKWRDRGIGRLEERSRLKNSPRSPGGNVDGVAARHWGKDSNTWQDNESELPTTIADRIL